ncbi:hypothetical protein TUM4438_06600 [Shewanella sairae]|uniref:DUF1449 family protein n=1 Tax=Shewanella sairae TaxID=190310 RepID=A0ABQ4P2H0_9GAMM|nr:OB-fold-containig protein [Shewanella sairae]MCL1128284.1 YqiJ family protein [Shewanella sairae]GIU41708.1 hypothetical protein TUM4438_06600 [Shewanella sairae]
MESFLFSQQSLPYTIALLLVFLFWLLESFTLVLGASLAGLLSAKGVSLESEAPQKRQFLGGLYAWLNIESLPALTWFTLAFMSFGLVGLLINYIAIYGFSSTLSQLLLLPTSIIFMFCCCHYLGNFFVKRIPANIPQLISVEELNGSVAKVGSKAILGYPSAATVIDQHQQEHQIYVEPATTEIEFSEGALVALVSRKGRVWQATPLDN